MSVSFISFIFFHGSFLRQFIVWSSTGTSTWTRSVLSTVLHPASFSGAETPDEENKKQLVGCNLTRVSPVVFIVNSDWIQFYLEDLWRTSSLIWRTSPFIWRTSPFIYTINGTLGPIYVVCRTRNFSPRRNTKPPVPAVWWGVQRLQLIRNVELLFVTESGCKI